MTSRSWTPVARPSPRLRLTAGVAGTIVIADDYPSNLLLFRELLEAEGHGVVTAKDGVEALQLVRQHLPDLVLSDCMMPELDGFELCRLVRQSPRTRLIPVILMTASDDEGVRLRGIEAGADDFLHKPVRVRELAGRVRSLVKLKRQTDALDPAESLVLSLSWYVDARDARTGGHRERMTYCAAFFGTHLGLSPDAVLTLRRGACLHDIGTIALPDSLLRKTGPLTDAEFDEMKRHTIVGDELCARMTQLQPVRPIIRQHHEHLDGSGYPDGARGDDISLLAQIIGIIDVFDALTTDRPYRSAVSAEAAYVQLRSEVEKGWRRSDLVDEFIRLARAGSLPLRTEQSSHDNLPTD